MISKKEKMLKRKLRNRNKIRGGSDRLRLCVFRSLNHIYAQLIDDSAGETVLSAGDQELKKRTGLPVKRNSKEVEKEGRKIALSFAVGKLVAEKALEKKIEKVAFDRGPYKYSGRVKALAEGAREGGLKF